MGESSHAILGSDLVGSRPRRVLLRLQRDERLVALIRSGDDRAFEVLFNRHRVRLLGFCRGMLGDVDDAEDVMQEVFAAAHAAMLADQRDLAVRPWLYRIARNRCLNHLRGVRALSSDKLDGHPHGNGASTQDRAETRDELRALLESVKDLPETQRGALLLRELDDLSYDEIARAMGTTMPAVKSLLVRARVTLAEASRARELTCAEVRLQLAEAAEGMRRTAGEVRHHVRHCPHCEAYRRHLRSTRRGLGALALAPLGILAALQRLLGLGGSGGAAASGGATASGGAAASGTAVSLAAGGVGLTGSKLVATAAVATLVGAGAGEITKGSEPDARPRPAPTQNAALAPAAAPEPVSVAPAPAVTAPAHPPATPTRPDDDRADPATRAPDPSKTDAPDAPPAPPRRTPVDEAPVPEEPPPPAAEEPAPPSTDPLEGTGDESLATPTTPPRADYGDDPDTILNPDPLPTPDEPPAPPTPSPPPDVSPPKPPTGTPRAPTTDREGAAPAADCAIAGGCPVP
jgi:RNA polymerase sigma factor (sigma-70 family)